MTKGGQIPIEKHYRSLRMLLMIYFFIGGQDVYLYNAKIGNFPEILLSSLSPNTNEKNIIKSILKDMFLTFFAEN